MEKKTLQEVSPAVRESYVRALKSCGRDVEIAIEGLKQVVKAEPGLMVAREKLRDQERRKAQSMGAFAKMLASLGGSFKAAKVVSLVSRDPAAALAAGEDVLASYVYVPAVLNAMADAAENCEAPFIAVDVLNLAREAAPNNEAVLRRLAKALQQNNQSREGLKIFQEIAAKYPNNLQVQSELRAALALASMERGNWESEGTTQEKARGAKENITAQISEGIIRSEDQALQVIEKLQADLQNEDSVDTRRRLADACMVAGRYDEAIEQYNKIAEKLGVMDPLLDKNIEKAKCAKWDEAAGNAASEEEKAKFVQERDAYRMERALDRVQKYPADALLRFELALLYFDKGQLEEALEQFQQARRSPQRRLTSLVYMGRCFAGKGQYDLAVEQFDAAISEMVRMDKEKMEAIYFKGTVLEKASRSAEAMECYKEIYQNQANFRDVAQKIDEYYKNNK